jgi:hypothetical protein
VVVRRLALLLLAVALAVALAGCGGTSGPAAADLVARTTAATGAQKSFHFAVTVEHPPPAAGGLNLTSAEGDVLVPDRLKAKVAGTYGGLPITSQVVFLRAQQYLLNPLSHTWQSFSTATSPIAFFSPAKGVLAAVDGAAGLEVDGTATVDGVQCYHLVGNVPARLVTAFLGGTPNGRAAGAQIDVGKDDGLLRRLTLAGPIAAGEPDDVVRTVVLSRFGEPVSIVAPAVG